jgi:hypothetical protein
VSRTMMATMLSADAATCTGYDPWRSGWNARAGSALSSWGKGSSLHS